MSTCRALKSALDTDFALQQAEFAVLPDPFELVDEAWDSPTTASFAAQLRVSVDRSNRPSPPSTTSSSAAP